VIAPTPPKVDIRRKLIEVQLAHAPEIIPSEAPENIDAFIFRDFEFARMKIFMLTTRPMRTDVTLVRMKFGTASTGR